MSYATLWSLFHWVVPAGVVVWLLLMLVSAWKDKLPATLIFGTLLTLFVGAYPAMRFSGLGPFIKAVLAGSPPPDVTDEHVTKLFMAAGLWCIVLTVPGPFIAVVVQVVVRTFKRARAGV